MIRWTDLPLAGALGALAVARAVLAGGLAGSPGAEVYGHAWVQWWAARQWPAWPGGTPLADGTTSWPVIDPLPTWIIAGVAHLVGPTAAWNLYIGGSVALAALGGAALARVTLGVPQVGAIGLATAPIFLGSLTSGLTEDGALGLVALCLAAAFERRWALAGALLGVTALCGLYLAWLGGLASLGVALWDLWARRGDRPGLLAALRGWATAGLIALALAAVAAAPFATRLGGDGHRQGAPPSGRADPMWRANPWRGADLATFVLPGRIDVEGAFLRVHPVYLGGTTLVLAALAGPSPAWLAVAASVAVAPGEHPTLAGAPLGTGNPAVTLFRALPLGDRFNHLARVMLIGQLVLVTLAARGAATSARRARVATICVALEAWLLSPLSPVLPVAPTTTPDIYAALTGLPEGPVVVLGAAGPGIHPQRVFFDQRAHGRRLLHNPNRPMDGKPRQGVVLVALGAERVARATARYGAPAVERADGAAWWVE